MTPRGKLTVFSALATALAALCMSPLLTTKGWITHALLVIVVLAAAGAGLRRAPVYRWSVPVLQLLVLIVLLLFGFTASTAWGGVLPGPRSLDSLGVILRSGVRDIQEYAIPAPPTEGLRLILVGSIGIIALVVDAVAVTYRRAALAGLPLLALYSVGTGLAGDSGSWVWFAVAAAGYLVLLFAEGQDRLSRWGRVFRGTARGTESTGTVSQSGQRVGVAALAIALLLPVVLPRLDGGLIDARSGSGTGSGTGVGGTSALDPLVSLAASVAKPSSTELLTYRMDRTAAENTYLRTSSLDEFNGTEWKLSSPAVTEASGNILFGAPEGMTDPTGYRRINAEFNLGSQLEAPGLPMPYPAATAAIPGDWRVDGLTATVMPDKGQSTKGLRYQVTGYDVRPTPANLRTARTADPRIVERYTRLPAGMPPIVLETAREVTRGAGNAYDKAWALQTWFTGPEFRYDLEVDKTSGTKAIERFLQERSGFCVHYASTMAAMARSLGIPARVATGFTPGTARGDGQYVVTGMMYHAWPELYFQGYGWLRFEPTPTRGIAPGYAVPAPAPTTAPTQQPTAVPSASAAVPQPTTSSTCDPKLRRLGECGDEGKAAAGASDEEVWLLTWPALATLGGVLVLVALLLTPMTWRLLRRRRRLGAGGRRRPGGDGHTPLTDEQVLAAWDELIESAWDLGVPPDDSRTPRAAARRIADSASLDESAAAAAGRVALATERVLYSRAAEVSAPLASDVRAARDGLRAGAGRAGRTRAVLLPASSVQLWWRLSDAVLTARLAVRGTVSRVVEAVTGPFRRAWGRLRGRRKDS
ncbi:transglutaminase family protein [Kitasatospora sp. NPDC004240]